MSYLFHESFNKNSLRFACPNIFIGIFIICWQIFLICVPVLFFYYIEIYNITLILCISFLFILFNGTRMRALGNIIHECCHYNYVPSKSANIKIGTLLSALELGCFVSYKKEHYSHHKYLGDILFDEDFKVRHKIGICNEKAFCLKGFIQIVLSPKNWFFILKSSIKMDLKNKNLNIIRLIYLVLFFVLSFIFNFKLVFFFIILPYLTSYQMMKIVSDFLDHGGLYFKEKREQKTRNHYFSIKLFNWIFFPRNDCFHLTHHLFPGIPTTRLYEKHKSLLEEKPDYAKRRHSLF